MGAPVSARRAVVLLELFAALRRSRRENEVAKMTETDGLHIEFIRARTKLVVHLRDVKKWEWSAIDELIRGDARQVYDAWWRN